MMRMFLNVNSIKSISAENRAAIFFIYKAKNQNLISIEQSKTN